MKIEIRHGDITKDALDCDVIVNAANPRMLGGGGVDGSIHRAAGPRLRDYCAMLPEVEPGVRCPVGEVVLTPAFGLPHKGIIHTVGPMFPSIRARAVIFPGEGISENPENDLERCLRNVLQKVQNEGFRSVALPAISCGVYGCEIPVFAEIAMKVLRERKWNLDKVKFVIFEEPDFDMFKATVTLIQVRP